MKFTIPGKDVIRITDEAYENNEKVFKSDDKIHIIKFDFNNPTAEKIGWAIKNFPSTNRFIVYNNIKIYNNYLKKTNKKYYIENNENDKLISFFKKNNKVLLNFFKIDENTRNFILDNCFDDVLFNTEVIYIDNNIYKLKKETLDLWKGNIILSNTYNL